MRPEHLYYLLEIEKQRSISGAAKTLYIGPSALSSILNKIESELGFQLFRRTHTGLAPTTEGEEALVLIREIVSYLNDVESLKDNSTEDAMQVCLLCSPSISASLSMPLSDLFQHQFSDCNLMFNEDIESHIKTKIMRGEANVALAYLSDKTANTLRSMAEKYQLKIKRIYQDQYYLIMSPTHPLSSLQAIDLSSLKGYHFAMLPKYGSEAAKSDSILNLQDNNHYTIFSNLFLVRQAVLNHNMLSIVHGISIFRDMSGPQKSLHALPVGTQIPLDKSDIYLIHRKISDLCQPEKFLVECIEDYFSESPNFETARAKP